jgi:hypothetical protein
MTVWADANQRVLRELVEFSTATAKEGVRLYGELQQGAIEVLRDSQAAAGRWQASWSDSAKDPVLDSVEKAFKHLEGHAQALTRSAERFQASAEQAGKGIQETCTAVVTTMKDVYSQN